MMTLSEIEKRFNRAMQFSFPKKKFLFVFPTVALCAIIILFSRSISLSETWMRMSLVFLAIFLASAILLSLGVFLIRIYYHEVKNLKLNITKVFSRSFEIMVGAAYLSFPLVVIFLLLWVLLGVFYFLSKIPKIGPTFDSVLAFAPFILIFCFVVLCFINICILFFVAPSIGLKMQKNLKLAKAIIKNFKVNLFRNFLAFIIGVLPIAIITLMLLVALNLTNIYFFYSDKDIDFVRWFFLSLPVSFILTPFIIFFFNFAAEMHQLFLKR